MNFTDWYTDTVDVYRIQNQTTNNLTTQQRGPAPPGAARPAFPRPGHTINMQQDAAYIKQADRLMCDPSVDIQPGDQLIIHRGAVLGRTAPDIRAFAADPNYYFEPFGAIMPGLAHQEIRLLQQEIVKGGTT